MSEAAGVLALIGRVLFAVYFAVSGLGFHVGKSKMAEDYAAAMRFPVPAVAGWPTGIWMTAGAFSIALGIWPDLGALMLIAFAVPAAAWFHRFWEVEDPMQRQMQQGFFWRNVIVVGASLFMFAAFTTAGDAFPYTITGPAFAL
jgi:putative oxidoreductase